VKSVSFAVFHTRPAIVEQSAGVVVPLSPAPPPDAPELLVEPEPEPELEEVEPLLEELLGAPPELLLVEPELEVLLVEPELEVLLVEPEPELLLVDPELPPEEPDPLEDPELDAPPSSIPASQGESVPPHAPTALNGIETARHTKRERVSIGVLREVPERTPCHAGLPRGLPLPMHVSQPGCAQCGKPRTFHQNMFRTVFRCELWWPSGTGFAACAPAGGVAVQRRGRAHPRGFVSDGGPFG
jgi:hypothetical protein